MPVDEVKIYSKKMLHELMTRNGYSLPALNSGYVTIEQLILVRDGKIFGLRQDKVIHRECTRPPSIRCLVDKLHHYLSQLGKDSGISMKRENFPDKAWLLRAIASLSEGEDEIFAPDYVPVAADMRR